MTSYIFLEIDGMHVWSDGTVLDYARGHFNRYPTGRPDKVYTSEDCVEEVKQAFISCGRFKPSLDKIAQRLLLERRELLQIERVRMRAGRGRGEMRADHHAAARRAADRDSRAALLSAEKRWHPARIPQKCAQTQKGSGHFRRLQLRATHAGIPICFSPPAT